MKILSFCFILSPSLIFANLVDISVRFVHIGPFYLSEKSSIEVFATREILLLSIDSGATIGRLKEMIMQHCGDRLLRWRDFNLVHRGEALPEESTIDSLLADGVLVQGPGQHYHIELLARRSV